MLWVFIGLLGGFAFVFLTRFYWADAANSPEGQSPPRKPIVTLAIVTLIIALLVMISTGRLNWLSAALTAAIPFLRRGFSLLRYAPLFSELLRKASGPSSKQTPSTAKASGLSIEQARAMLEVPIGAEKDQIVAAHRRLMAKNHPDRGGSNYIAAQLNEAKELLLKTLQSK